LYANAPEYAEYISLLEFSINNSQDFILKEIRSKSPDILCFSCYIWNISIVKELAANIRKISPNIKIILGGPEVSFPPYELLGEFADIIVFGEGEAAFEQLCKHFFLRSPSLSEINGIAYYSENLNDLEKNIRINEPRELPDLNRLAFPYENLNGLSNKIVYYESSRGCPFSCAYCISSATNGVRFLDIETAKSHIGFFLENKVKLVKFVDRTFNCEPERALRIWQYIIANDNGITGFHFEVGADLITDVHIDCLKHARPGLIQFEAGVQSTNEYALREVCRVSNFDKLRENVIKVKGLNNIHLHLDLIAGLPFEDFESFKKSFNDCFALRPDMLQLGFLKLLQGSNLRRYSEKYGIAYRDKAPYEVLFTDHISFDELSLLKDVENIVDIYYNSGIFAASIEYAVSIFLTPFDFFYNFSLYWNEKGFHRESHSKQERYEILFRYLSGVECTDLAFLKDLLKFDMFMNENVKNLPKWLERTDYTPIRDRISAFFANEANAKAYFPKLLGRAPKELQRICHLERFSCNVLDWVNGCQKVYSPNYCLFVYEGSKPKVFSVNL